jgi:hypothetical protein
MNSLLPELNYRRSVCYKFPLPKNQVEFFRTIPYQFSRVFETDRLLVPREKESPALYWAVELIFLTQST